MTSGADAEAAERCRQYVHDFWGGVAGQVLCNAVTWRVLPEVDVVDSTDGEVSNTFVGTVSHTSTGGGGSNSAPPSSAALFQWQTATWLGGRNLKGRSYISPISSSVVDAYGGLDGTVQSATQSDLDDYLAAFEEGDSQVVWRRERKADAEHDPPITHRDGANADIVSGTVRAKLGVLVSRRD
jgi:hypothetical protein